MGGYGASRIGMKHADVFGALYMMSPCCMSPRPADQIDPKALSKLEAIEAPGDAADLSFMEKATLATAAACSPDPKNPPLYPDLPTTTDRTSAVYGQRVSVRVDLGGPRITNDI